MKESIKINFKRHFYDWSDTETISIDITHVNKDGSESVCMIPEREITIEEAWLDVVKSLLPKANIMVEDEVICGSLEEEDNNE